MNSVVRKYLQFYNDADESTVLRALEAHPRNVLYNDDLVLMFLRLNDANFEMLQSNPALLLNEAFLAYCYEDEGDNIHIVKGFGSARALRKLMAALTERAKTVTFYRDDLKKLHVLYRRDSQCHFLRR